MKLRTALAVLLIAVAAAAGATAALAIYRVDRDLTVGTVRLSTEPGRKGALDIYVPLVDWGVRFDAVRLPARLHVDVRAVNRNAVARLAQGQTVDVRAAREQVEGAVTAYVQQMLAVVALAALLTGTLMALALRSRTGPRLRWLLAAAVAAPIVITAAVALLFPPRGALDNPEYYANGPDIPRALRAIENATASARTLSEELDAQLIGLARLVAAPGGRLPVEGLPRLTVASDLHNNVLGLPTLERAAGGGPLLFAGDLTDTGSQLETEATRRVVRSGKPFVFVSGNHDSDSLLRRLATEGAVVLTDRGRLLPEGGFGDVVVDVAGVRVAGYSDPFERRSAEGFRDRFEGGPTVAQQEAFAAWLQPLLGRVDVVMVHEPALAERALADLRVDPPDAPLTFVVGHTHEPGLETGENLVVLNGGTAGGGGTGNLLEGSPVGVAVLTYQPAPAFRPLAADLVTIDPGNGSAKAERNRLDLSGR